MGRNKKVRHNDHMPKYVKAARKRQGQCTCGRKIQRGDPYWWHKTRHGSKQIRCNEHPFRRSELTTSDKLATLYAAQEALESEIESVRDGDDFETVYSSAQQALASAIEAATEVAEQYDESADNQPDSLQESTRERAQSVRDWIDALEACDTGTPASKEEVEELANSMQQACDALEL